MPGMIRPMAQHVLVSTLAMNSAQLIYADMTMHAGFPTSQNLHQHQRQRV